MVAASSLRPRVEVAETDGCVHVVPARCAIVSADHDTEDGRAAVSFLRGLGLEVLFGADGLERGQDIVIVSAACNAARQETSRRISALRSVAPAAPVLRMLTRPDAMPACQSGMVETADEVCAEAIASGHFCVAV